VFFIVSLVRGVPAKALWLYVPVAVATVVLVVFVINGHWRKRNTLEKLCGANILVNLGTTASYIIAVL
jgi:1,4-dihydroxy-2-naphthoate octaprenyltransferase